MSGTDIAPCAEQAIAPTVDSPASLIASMVADPACDPAKLEKLLHVRREWEADEARKAFAAALAGFQKDCPIVPKLDTAHGRPYARIDRIWRMIRPVMDRYGLSVTWHTVSFPDGACVIDGNLTHADGHAQPIHYELSLPNSIAGQNEAQRRGSATTYAKRYAMCAVLGVQTGEDDDAEACTDPITADQAALIRQLLTETGADEVRYLQWLGSSSVDVIPASRFGDAAGALQRKRRQQRDADASADLEPEDVM